MTEVTKIEACIFDLDGVLVDTARYHYIAWKALAKNWDIDLTEVENEKLKGVSRINSLKHILSLKHITLKADEITHWCSIKNDHYLSLIEDMNKEELLPGAEEILKELKGLGIKIGLGSASKNAPAIIAKTGIDHYFEAVVSGNDVTKSKPDPEVFIKGAKILESAPNHTIVFEDSQKGIEAANSGGFISIGIGEAEALKDAQIVLSGFKNTSFADILEHIKKTN